MFTVHSNTMHTFLITGAGSGVGRGLSIEFARGGHRVLATDLDGAAAEETVSLAGDAGRRVEACRLDVTSEAEVEALSGRLGERAVDVLVNNAGLQHVARLESFPQEKWDRLVDVMLCGAASMLLICVP